MQHSLRFQRLRVKFRLIARDDFVADLDEREARGAGGIELLQNLFLGRLVSKIVVDEVERDVALGEILLRLPA